MKQYRSIAKRFAPNSNPDDVIFYYGVAKAYDTVKLLYAAGKNPTRASLMKATRQMKWASPYALKGMTIKTSATDRFPLDQVKLIRYQNGSWSEISPLMKAR